MSIWFLLGMASHTLNYHPHCRLIGGVLIALDIIVLCNLYGVWWRFKRDR